MFFFFHPYIYHNPYWYIQQNQPLHFRDTASHIHLNIFDFIHAKSFELLFCVLFSIRKIPCSDSNVNSLIKLILNLSYHLYFLRWIINDKIYYHTSILLIDFHFLLLSPYSELSSLIFLVGALINYWLYSSRLSQILIKTCSQNIKI